MYGKRLVTERGPLPAHLLGDVWAQTWEIYDLVSPFPNATALNITQEMIKQVGRRKRTEFIEFCIVTVRINECYVINYIEYLMRILGQKICGQIYQ